MIVTAFLSEIETLVCYMCFCSLVHIACLLTGAFGRTIVQKQRDEADDNSWDRIFPAFFWGLKLIVLSGQQPVMQSSP